MLFKILNGCNRYKKKIPQGNVVTANASVEAIKFSMANVITSEGGELTQTVLTLSDGTTTLIKTEEGKLKNHMCYCI